MSAQWAVTDRPYRQRNSFWFFASGIQAVEVQDGVVNEEVAALCFGAPHWIVGKKDNVSTTDGNVDDGWMLRKFTRAIKQAGNQQIF